MEQRRQGVAESASSLRKNGAMGLALTAGAGLLAGFGSMGFLGKWARSLIWAVAVPALLNTFKSKGNKVLGTLTQALTSHLSSDR